MKVKRKVIHDVYLQVHIFSVHVILYMNIKIFYIYVQTFLCFSSLSISKNHKKICKNFQVYKDIFGL